MRPIVTDRVAWFVGRSVCRSVTVVSQEKTVEPIHIPFGLWASRNHVLDGVQIPQWEGAILRGGAKLAAHCKKYKELPN